MRLGCVHFEVYEQVGANWNPNQATGRFVQTLRFDDRKCFMAHQQAEKSDPGARRLLLEFCEMINLPYQMEQGLFAVGYYISFAKMPGKAAETPLAEMPAEADDSSVSQDTSSST